MKKIFIGVCDSQDVHNSGFFWSVIGQEDFVAQPVFARAVHPWDVIRNNQLIAWFLDSDCDYFAKMDVDQNYPRDYFKVMVPLIEEYKVIGPLIFDRPHTGNFMPLVNWVGCRKDNHFNIKDRSGIEEVPYLHTNLFYHREVLEAIPQPWYEAEMSQDGLKRANHVDITFTKKIPKAGYKIHVNYDVVVEHIASVPISRGVYERWQGGSS